MSSAPNILEKRFSEHLDDLKRLVRIPSVSFEGFDRTNVTRSAEEVAKLLKARGFENVELLTIPGTHPYVYGERLKAPGKPTVLLYAHHDVQPPGREPLWQTPPFEPTEKDGPGGLRLYGRGTADDKAGIIVHTAAVASWLEAHGELPLNVKIVVEGEEEIGSGGLPTFLKTYRKKLDADYLILTDTTNFDCGVPALTVALRGLVAVDVEVRALSKTVHSGMWGGPIPDPVQALAKILATLSDAEGRIAVPGLLDHVRALTPEEQKELDAFPFDENAFRTQSGMLPGVRWIESGPAGVHLKPTVQLWRHPSLTVTALEASSRKNAANIINDTAWARVTVRLVADMQPEQVTKLLTEHFKKTAPWGVSVDVKPESGSGAWSIDPFSEKNRNAFEAADRALEKGYGVKALKIGCGGSIPFVKPFADALGGAPALLVGVEDPYTNAHGENESLLISDLKKACLSQVHLFEELSRL